ncbi:unnamed protein product [Cochlearia groenlandica]
MTRPNHYIDFLSRRSGSSGSQPAAGQPDPPPPPIQPEVDPVLPQDGPADPVLPQDGPPADLPPPPHQNNQNDAHPGSSSPGRSQPSTVSRFQPATKHLLVQNRQQSRNGDGPRGFRRIGLKPSGGTVSNMKKDWKRVGDAAKPESMDGAVWQGLAQYWTDPHSIHVSGGCSKARMTKIDDIAPCVHTSGQSSYTGHLLYKDGGGRGIASAYCRDFEEDIEAEGQDVEPKTKKNRTFGVGSIDKVPAASSS